MFVRNDRTAGWPVPGWGYSLLALALCLPGWGSGAYRSVSTFAVIRAAASEAR